VKANLPGSLWPKLRECVPVPKRSCTNDGRGRARAAQVARYLCANPALAPSQVLYTVSTFAIVRAPACARPRSGCSGLVTVLGDHTYWDC
jgi:hypothetical protein